MFLQSVVAEADDLLEVARVALEQIPPDAPERGRLHEAAGLLAQLLLQDIERRADGIHLKQGVSPERVVSVFDPEMRHGRKSASRRLDGHKGAIAVDPESQLITAVDVLPGNALDHERALELVTQSEANAEGVVEETVGDCAYGDGGTRQLFADAGRKLVAKVASRQGGAQFPKEDFRIDLERMSCTCPAGQQTRKVVSISSGKRYGAPGVPLRAFRFDAAICDACPLRPKCVRARPGKGRLVMVHPYEALLQEARAFQQSDSFAPLPQTTSGRRTSTGPVDATWCASGSLCRSDQDALPTPYGRYCRQSHACGDENRPHARSQPPQDDYLYTYLRLASDTDRDLPLICNSVS